MVIDTFHIILIGLVIILLVGVIYVFAKSKLIKHIDPLNQKYIEEMKDLLNNKVDNLTESIIKCVYSSFSSYYLTFTEKIKEMEKNEFSINDTKLALNWAKIDKLKNECDDIIYTSAQGIVKITNSHLSNIVSKYPEVNLQKFQKNFEQRHSSSQRFQSILKQSLTQFYRELSHLQNLQSRCIILFSPIEENLNNGTKEYFVDLVKAVGVGLFAAFNPPVGIPAAVATVASAFQKYKKDDNKIDEFNKIYCEYISKWSTVQKTYESTYKNLKIDLIPVLHYEFNNQIFTPIVEVAKGGYSLKEFVDYFKSSDTKY